MSEIVLKVPVVELSECVLCGVCVEVTPSVFRINEAGYVEAFELTNYPEAEVEGVIKNCPQDCITWEQI